MSSRKLETYIFFFKYCWEGGGGTKVKNKWRFAALPSMTRKLPVYTYNDWPKSVFPDKFSVINFQFETKQLYVCKSIIEQYSTMNYSGFMSRSSVTKPILELIQFVDT